MNSTIKTLVLWAIIFVVVILLWNTFQAGKAARTEVPFSFSQECGSNEKETETRKALFDNQKPIPSSQTSATKRGRRNAAPICNQARSF